MDPEVKRKIRRILGYGIPHDPFIEETSSPGAFVRANLPHMTERKFRRYFGKRKRIHKKKAKRYLHRAYLGVLMAIEVRHTLSRESFARKVLPPNPIPRGV